jgi:hypothetical protein
MCQELPIGGIWTCGAKVWYEAVRMGQSLGGVHMRALMRLAIAVSCVAIWLLVCPAYASVAYISSSSGEPWSTLGVTSNLDNMDAAFGAGNWQRLNFDSAVANGIFAPGAYSFLYFDGGDGTDTEFNSFLNANRTALESWVASGGRVFLNSAGWDVPTIDVGFALSLSYFDGFQYYESYNATAAIAHEIFTPQTGTSWTGDFFSHDIVVGSDFTTLINGDVGPVLVEKDWGLGHVLVGGMTSTYFHQPQPEADDLRVNILRYGASQAAAVPEPATIVIWSLLGSAAIALGWRRRRVA